jgi:hypothetical protein
VIGAEPEFEIEMVSAGTIVPRLGLLNEIPIVYPPPGLGGPRRLKVHYQGRNIDFCKYERTETFRHNYIAVVPGMFVFSPS